MGDIVYRCIDSWPDRKLAHMYSYLAVFLAAKLESMIGK
jgi:hypothetical protein